jgi:hypothetical protein
VSIQTYRSILLPAEKQILTQVQNGNRSMMTNFSKNLRDRFVRFAHQIVYDQQRFRRTVERIRIRETFSEIDIGILVELVLIYAETPNNFFRNGSYHLASERYKFQSKHGLSASGRTGYDSRKRMFPPRVHIEE